jgi:membrane-bound lytic murein transglycosylase A
MAAASAMAVALLAAACAPAPKTAPGKPPAVAVETMYLTAVSFERLTGWKAEDHAAALAPFVRSCGKLRTQPKDKYLGPDNTQGRVGDWLKICADAALIRPGNRAEAQYFFESRFTPYVVRGNGEEKGLFTGYYEPELRGSWKPGGPFRHPIYSRPKDLISLDLGKFRSEMKGEHLAGRLSGSEFIPYATREDIEAGALNGHQLELLWVNDPIDVFFLHIQGSGRVVFPDGSAVRIGYAGRNGHRYTPIGRELVAMGAIPPDKVSMRTIRDWLEANPLRGSQIMARNQSYIFFRVLDDDGPVGAQGVPLTAGRSLAVDTRFIPLGVPVWLNTTEPGKPKRPLRRLVVAQDTGSAIKGVVRGDLFVGFGSVAGIVAGEMRESGTYYLLLPKIPAS